MKSYKDKIIIGIDHGYGNIKTANHCFKTGITTHDSEPLFTKDMLTYNGKYYLIGEGHKEFLPEKQNDEDYYILTLAAIATELANEGLTEADVIIAAGLPLTWTSGQKADFAAYLSKNKEVKYTFRNVDYHIRICDIKIYPQGYSAVVPIKSTLKGLSMVADIGKVRFCKASPHFITDDISYIFLVLFTGDRLQIHIIGKCFNDKVVA